MSYLYIHSCNHFNSSIFSFHVQISQPMHNFSTYSFLISRWHPSLNKCIHLSIYLPAENETTAHFPFQPHFLAPLSPPPPSIARSSSSKPGLRPTTTSALQVRRARTLRPELVPRGPIAVVKGVVGSHVACYWLIYFHVIKQEVKRREEKRRGNVIF